MTRAFVYASLIALDAEGVDLSREGHRSEGVISIVQLATLQQSQCFILDVLGKGLDESKMILLLYGSALSCQPGRHQHHKDYPRLQDGCRCLSAPPRYLPVRSA